MANERPRSAILTAGLALEDARLTTGSAEVLDRYGVDSLVGRFMTRAAPAMWSAIARTIERSGLALAEASRGT
jgi:hypothetical protein